MKRRPDLDGARLREPGGHNVWLVFGGCRHRIASSAVYDALFGELDRLAVADDLHTIEMGPELNDGTCLVRGSGTLPVYLATGFPDVVLHLIPSMETVLDFGFDLGKVQDIPVLIVDATFRGDQLESANERGNRSMRR